MPTGLRSSTGSALRTASVATLSRPVARTAVQRDHQSRGFAAYEGSPNGGQALVALPLPQTDEHYLVEMPQPTHSDVEGSVLPPWVSLGDFLATQSQPSETEIVRPGGKRASELLALRPGTGIRVGGTVEHQRPGGHWGYQQDSFVADLSRPSRTIRAAATPDWLHLAEGMRRLTYRECAGLQGFPSGWRFPEKREARFRLIGNAVQTDMAAALGSSLLYGLKMGLAATPPTSAEWPAYFTRRIRGAQADHQANAATRKRHPERKAS